MSTTDLKCTPVPPKGTIVEGSKVLSPFSSPIVFPNARSNKPFPPIVQAYYNGTNLQVSAVVLIDAAAEIFDNITVYYDDTQSMPRFYVTYNAPEAKASEFTLYQVDFTLDLEKQPLTIETIVWDEDPVGSRGTTTTVQP